MHGDEAEKLAKSLHAEGMKTSKEAIMILVISVMTGVGKGG